MDLYRDHGPRLLEALFEDSPDAILLAGLDRRIRRVNAAARRMFGRPLVGEPTRVLYAREEDYVRQGERRFHAGADDDRAPYEVEYRRADGELFVGETVAGPVRAEHGAVIGFLGMVRDVTARRRTGTTLSRLYAITTAPGLSYERKVARILQLGTEAFDLPLGLVARIEDGRYEVRHALSLDADGPRPGDRFPLGDTYCSLTLRSGEPVGVDHVGASDVRSHPAYQRFRLEAYLGTPVLVDGEPYGTLSFSSAAPRRRPFDPHDLDLVRLLGEWIGNEIARERDLEALHAARRNLERLAATDPLTGAANRRRFLERSREEWHRAERSGRPLAVLLLDVDHFKRVNDTHGHASGDSALVAVADVCRRSLRTTDPFGRIGGEEFAVTLPEATVEDARRVADRLRRNVAALRLPTASPAGTPFRLTISVGVASTAAPDTSVDDVLARADAAMYAAKRAGRDRVVVAGDEAEARRLGA